MAKPKKPSVKVKDLGPKNDPKGGKVVDKIRTTAITVKGS